MGKDKLPRGMVQETTITPCLGGFGEYQAGYDWSEPIDYNEWLGELSPLDFVVLGCEQDQDWAVDIRGRIHNEPTWVVAVKMDDGQVIYVGLDPVEATDDFLDEVVDFTPPDSPQPVSSAEKYGLSSLRRATAISKIMRDAVYSPREALVYPESCGFDASMLRQVSWLVGRDSKI